MKPKLISDNFSRDLGLAMTHIYSKIGGLHAMLNNHIARRDTLMAGEKQFNGRPSRLSTYIESSILECQNQLATHHHGVLELREYVENDLGFTKDEPLMLDFTFNPPLECLGYVDESGKPLTCWLFSNRVYSIAELGVPSGVQAQLVKNEYAREQQLHRRILSHTIQEEIAGRKSITESVRIEVWRRDEGACVKCGGRERLEYDHIIPVTLGGGNTARNIELLCEACNRAKSNQIM